MLPDGTSELGIYIAGICIGSNENKLIPDHVRLVAGMALCDGVHLCLSTYLAEEYFDFKILLES